MNEREKIVELCKRAVNSGLIVASSGNISCKVGENMMIITPSGQRYEHMTPEDLVLCDFDGNTDKGKPSSEYKLHGEMYKTYKDVNAVVHVHSPYATAFALHKLTVPNVLLEMDGYIGGDVKCADFAPNGSMELATGAVEAIKDRKACLLENHGSVAIGKDLEAAYSVAEHLEHCCQVHILAKALDNNRQ